MRHRVNTHPKIPEWDCYPDSYPDPNPKAPCKRGLSLSDSSTKEPNAQSYLTPPGPSTQPTPLSTSAPTVLGHNTKQTPLLTSASTLPGPTTLPPPSMTSSKNSNSLHMLQININGIRNKSHELLHTLQTQDIHIALIQETKLSPSAKTPLFPGYTAVRLDRLASQGSGIMPLIKTDIEFTNTTNDSRNLPPPPRSL